MRRTACLGILSLLLTAAPAWAQPAGQDKSTVDAEPAGEGEPAAGRGPAREPDVPPAAPGPSAAEPGSEAASPGADLPPPDAVTPPTREAPKSGAAAAKAPAEDSAVPATGSNRVTIFRDAGGFKLRVDGRDTMVFGMNWAYMPIGENYNYDFWSQPDDFIKEALEREMSLLRRMGVNVIRQYVGIPGRWIRYIHDKYGIYTVLNHSMGRYGFKVGGVWQAKTNYADPRTRAAIKAEILDYVERLKNTRGLLFWLLGNENNYGLEWASAATEDLPEGERQAAKAKYLYTLYGEIIRAIKARDKHHPVALANGDLQYIDLVAEHCQGLDIFGANVYRGLSARDLFDTVKEKLDLPFVFTEFGADAYNAKERREDHLAQARYLRAQWQEIYEQSHGKGRAGNAIGGMTFQWSDGWWKHGQTTDLDRHDTTASWAADAYAHDYVKGDNNMNEEWFGICAKGKSDAQGLYRVTPRTAYYVLKEGYTLDPYAPDTTLTRVREHWGGIDIRAQAHKYEASSALKRAQSLELLKLTNVRMEFSFYTTGGAQLNEPAREQTRFDHMQSFYLDVESKPLPGVRAAMSVNIIGNVAENPMDEIFYENRGEPVTVAGKNTEPKTIEGLKRIKIHAAEVEWDESWFNLKGFYRTGHYHWGYEGDFFGLYREAYYGGSIDLYNADVPIGLEFTGKRALAGLKIAFGPELYWGANPMIIGKYERRIDAIGLDVALIHQEDIAQRSGGAVSTVIPEPKSRKTTLYLGRRFGPVKVELGGIMAGTPLLDEPFVRTEEADEGQTSYLNSGYLVLDDQVRMVDTLGAKAKVTLQTPWFNWYVQGAYKGVVADGGADETLTFTGWTLKENGRGNHFNVLSGATVNLGPVQIAPNFLYQKPLVDPLPTIADGFDPSTGTYFAGVRPRNILEDPFVVRGNQEMLGYELLIAFDPTPATFLWAFDNIRRENAWLAGSIDFVWRDYRQSQDANIGVFATGGLFAFASAPPAEDLWELRLRLISNPARQLRVAAELFGGRGQSRGSDTRLIDRFGGSFRLTWRKLDVGGGVRVNDWGPYDYYRDFNLTFPLQVMGDISYHGAAPSWFFEPTTRIGVRGQYRTLDEYSPRYRQATAAEGGDSSYEWEVLTYLHLSI